VQVVQVLQVLEQFKEMTEMTLQSLALVQPLLLEAVALEAGGPRRPLAMMVGLVEVAATVPLADQERRGKEIMEGQDTTGLEVAVAVEPAR
jgi:hypothetical protein